MGLAVYTETKLKQNDGSGWMPACGREVDRRENDYDTGYC